MAMSTTTSRFAIPSVQTILNLMIGGLVGLIIWEVWARVLTKAVLGYPLEPAGLIDAIFNHQFGLMVPWLLREALQRMGRMDLIGGGPECLVPAGKGMPMSDEKSKGAAKDKGGSPAGAVKTGGGGKAKAPAEIVRIGRAPGIGLAAARRLGHPGARALASAAAVRPSSRPTPRSPRR